VIPVRKPTWQQATALVSLSTCGAMTGFSFTHGTVAEMTAPTSMPVHLVDLSKPARPAGQAPAATSTLRAAIVNVASYYLRMAQTKTPAEMEALIWQSDSVNGADHGESCAAFASLTLELGAQAAGEESWVSGGTSYPWPLHQWADVRVDPNPDSLGVTSILQDAQAHQRWQPLGNGYQPQPGDWVLFDGHVEVVTKYAQGVLYTIGGDSLPDFSVNAHQYRGPLAAQGVAGFVNNGELVSAESSDSQPAAQSLPGLAGNLPGLAGGNQEARAVQAHEGQAAIPGTLTAALSSVGSAGSIVPAGPAGSAQTASTVTGPGASGGTAVIPGLVAADDSVPATSPPPAAPAHSAKKQPATVGSQVPDTAMQQAFISRVAPGAMAAQRRYGIPAAVTIAQAIEESGWGQSMLAVKDNNLFGIKGSGPAGSDIQPTREYENGRWVTVSAPFKVYHNVAESIADHGQLLASGSSYQQAMADRHVPDAFAADLTGVYATDPDYGSQLIALMRLYNLYQYDASAPAAPAVTPQSGTATAPDQGGASIPGVLDDYVPTPASTVPASTGPAARPAGPAAAKPVRRPAARVTARRTRISARYVPELPRTVTADFITTAKVPLQRAEPLYRDVANRSGIRWELLAACDWMQCRAQPQYSPVRGEKLGTVNPDSTIYRTKSEALSQCAEDLIELAMAVYWIDITARRPLSVRKLANIFAAFRWGGLLKLHNVSAMEFPYSVAGLTAKDMKMRWPDIGEPDAPDKPGSRFRRSFGAVPVVLSLDYSATDELSTAQIRDGRHDSLADFPGGNAFHQQDSGPAGHVFPAAGFLRHAAGFLRYEAVADAGWTRRSWPG
jgi:flagellum-specific peptidoglycan hydrolase FlgJ